MESRIPEDGTHHMSMHCHDNQRGAHIEQPSEQKTTHLMAGIVVTRDMQPLHVTRTEADTHQK